LLVQVFISLNTSAVAVMLAQPATFEQSRPKQAGKDHASDTYK